MNLHELNASVQDKPARHRVGRGTGSGWGTHAGRGQRGCTVRSGYKIMLHREGGQMPFMRRLPKRGFNNKLFTRRFAFVNLCDLNAFQDGDVVTPELCLQRGLVPEARSGLKVLGVGTLERKLTLKVHRVSAKARAAITERGGTIELLRVAGDEAKKRWLKKRGTGTKRTRQQKHAPKKTTTTKSAKG